MKFFQEIGIESRLKNTYDYECSRMDTGRSWAPKYIFNLREEPGPPYLGIDVDG